VRAALLALLVLVVIPAWRAGRGSSPPGTVGLIFWRRAGCVLARGSVDDEPVTGGEADAASAEHGIDEHPAGLD